MEPMWAIPPRASPPRSGGSRRKTLSVDYGRWSRHWLRCSVVPIRQRARDQAFVVAFGERVRQVRAEVGLTQEQLAEAAGLHPTFVANVERGYRVPTVPTMLKLAQGLGVEPSRLVDGLDTSP